MGHILKPTLFLCGFVSDQQMLEECEHQLQAHQQRCDAGEERLDWLVKALSTVRAGVEHLADKLQHITLVNMTLTIMTANSPTVDLTYEDSYKSVLFLMCVIFLSPPSTHPSLVLTPPLKMSGDNQAHICSLSFCFSPERGHRGRCVSGLR